MNRPFALSNATTRDRNFIPPEKFIDASHCGSCPTEAIGDGDSQHMRILSVDHSIKAMPMTFLLKKALP
jgi:hypothetical protein